jgi:transposase InsO family protein
MFEDEGYTAGQLAEMLGVSQSSVNYWAKLYRDGGPDALKDRRPTNSGGAGTQKTPEPIRAQIVALKRQFPDFGVKRISQLLRRLFFLPASPETVRQTLHEEELMPAAPRKKPKRNPEKPRFFERTTPNQLWQTDIFSFKLAGRQVYLLGFIDDYSRYIVGLELFTAQTASNVLEVYRRAVAEYGLPREMLTDNGRQYANWRGETRFQKEMAKDKVKHIRSQPHHPMTLGKIERFWKTIWTEYLDRAQFGSFDEARTRIGLWIRSYNHKRPHQGIGGLCPADRYFEIQTELKAAIEQGIADNVLELALRGEVQAPFYLVGRLDKQSVVMQARKGKLTMSVGADGAPENTLTYDLKETDNEPEAQRGLEIAHPGQPGYGPAPPVGAGRMAG